MTSSAQSPVHVSFGPRSLFDPHQEIAKAQSSVLTVK
jgi:hypothetical protein